MAIIPNFKNLSLTGLEQENKSKIEMTDASSHRYEKSCGICNRYPGKFEYVCHRHRKSFYRHFVHQATSLIQKFSKKDSLEEGIPEPFCFFKVAVLKTPNSSYSPELIKRFVDFLVYPHIDLSQFLFMRDGCLKANCSCHLADDFCPWVKPKFGDKKVNRRRCCYKKVEAGERFCDEHMQHQYYCLRCGHHLMCSEEGVTSCSNCNLTIGTYRRCHVAFHRA